jgi:type IV secretory pathway VirB6-like protein
MFFRIYNPSASCLISSNNNNNQYVETFETTAVEDEIKERIAQRDIQGREVKYWKVLDTIRIVRIKG